MPVVVVLMSNGPFAGSRLLRDGLGQRSGNQGDGADDRHISTCEVISGFHCWCSLSGCRGKMTRQSIAQPGEVKRQVGAWILDSSTPIRLASSGRRVSTIP